MCRSGFLGCARVHKSFSDVFIGLCSVSTGESVFVFRWFFNCERDALACPYTRVPPVSASNRYKRILYGIIAVVVHRGNPHTKPLLFLSRLIDEQLFIDWPKTVLRVTPRPETFRLRRQPSRRKPIGTKSFGEVRRSALRARRNIDFRRRQRSTFCLENGSNDFVLKTVERNVSWDSVGSGNWEKSIGLLFNNRPHAARQIGKR